MKDLDPAQIERWNLMGIDMPVADSYSVSREALAAPGEQPGPPVALVGKAIWNDGSELVIRFSKMTMPGGPVKGQQPAPNNGPAPQGVPRPPRG